MRESETNEVTPVERNSFRSMAESILREQPQATE